MNKIFETETFSKIFDSCDNREKQWINKVKDLLKNNLEIGKPLRFEWFREKKLGNKRLYYIINKNTNKVIMLSFGPKKDQQKIINHILENRDIYLDFVN